MPNPIILYELSCGHVQPGRIGSLRLQCLNCNPVDWKEIVDVHVYEWRAKCNDCNLSAWSGLSQMLAAQRANAHARKRPTHSVKVQYVANPEAKKIRDRITEGRENAPSPVNPKAP